MKIFIISIFLGMLLNGCSWINQKLGLEDDNLIEETSEYIIQKNTGIDVDLTPSTPEKP